MTQGEICTPLLLHKSAISVDWNLRVGKHVVYISTKVIKQCISVLGKYMKMISEGVIGLVTNQSKGGHIAMHICINSHRSPLSAKIKSNTFAVNGN